MGFTLAIVGAGLTGTSLLLQFTLRLQQAARSGVPIPSEMTVEIFDRHAAFGPGLPHNPAYVLPFHITNMCARDMGIRADAPEDFQHWVDANRQMLGERFPELVPHFCEARLALDGCAHYPRAVMGEYLKARFAEAVQAARALDIAVVLHPQTEALDLVDEADGIRVVARRVGAGENLVRKADRALLATGHWFSQQVDPRLVPAPWPADVLRRGIPEGADVGVIGSSLSAIESVLTLTSTGRFVRSASDEFDFLPSPRQGRIALYSRHGLLPKVRGRTGSRRNRILTAEALQRLLAQHPGKLNLAQVFGLLDAELMATYGRPVDWREILAPQGSAEQCLQRYLAETAAGDGPEGEVLWQTVLAELLPFARELYLNLEEAERARFDREYTTLFFMHAATQPAINAEKLHALVRRGIVVVRKLDGDYRLEKCRDRAGYLFVYRDDKGAEQRDFYPYVVDARGQSSAYSGNPAPLARNLCTSGTVALTQGGHLPGSILIDPKTHRVQRRGADGSLHLSMRLYAVGAMTRGQMIDASMARGLVLSTAGIAEDFAQQALASVPGGGSR